jgi:NAD(P)-dependent dehydrogenase (short-subunit alcohol dehydrogenase family)
VRPAYPAPITQTSALTCFVVMSVLLVPAERNARRQVCLSTEVAPPIARVGSPATEKGDVVESFAGRLAVVTGGGTGMGRELVVQLAAEGCSVATCDVNSETVAETALRAEKEAPAGVRITTHQCDVSDESQVQHFRDEVVAQHETDHINLLFNNAGIGGGGSFITGPRAEWDRTFGVCWGGVYHCSRAFVPLLVASDDGYLVNTSSVNGFWASLGPGVPHTAYSSAKFAVKGFSEALLEDFRVNAPHVKVAVVMPGHIGTEIVNNSRKVHGTTEPEDMSPAELETVRANFARRGMAMQEVSDDDLRKLVRSMGDMFRENAPVSAAEAATVILDGVRKGQWRILVGADAHALDAAVRADPEAAYGASGLDLRSITTP